MAVLDFVFSEAKYKSQNKLMTIWKLASFTFQDELVICLLSGFFKACEASSFVSNSLEPHGLYADFQVPLPTEFFRRKYWSGLPFPPPRVPLPGPGIKSESPVSPALQAGSLPTEPLGNPFFNAMILTGGSPDQKL